ncbi:polysaccharide deacetylase family protein [Leptolyngbya sp. NIES-2104]|uniref:polysaccharide deacetylase family protein n=1 Tax=Leptolyngbya sp. NIES-2104 TaxID=1552121 RepID=UPI00073EC467|nr:polysaccharide deacetylase family protein [Leptolyngbya sp. NIES-2104]
MNSTSISPMRWHLKKLARRLMILSSLVLNPFGNARRSQIRVLTYHRFGDQPRDPFCVTPEDFEAQMAWLARHKRAVSMEQVERFLRGEIDLPAGSVLVTIDDGYQSVHDLALPILKKYKIPAVVFVTVSAIDHHEDPEPHLTWNEVKTLASHLTVASHGWTHRSLGKISLEEMRLEVTRSRRMLEEKLRIPVTAFAYPFGTMADFNATTATVLQESQYQFAFTSQHGAIAERESPLNRFYLPRIKVEGGEGLWMFRLLVGGGLDHWRLIDQTLWKLQQSPGRVQG